MPIYQITAPNGKTYRVEGPAGATDAQVRAEVLRQHPDAGTAVRNTATRSNAPTGRTSRSIATDIASNVFTGMAFIPDLLSQGGNLIGRGLYNVADFAATGGGASPQNTLGPNPFDRPATTVRGLNEKINPGYEDRRGAFAAQMLGGALTPIPMGPKPLPYGGNALTNAARAEKAATTVAQKAAPVVRKGVIPNAKEVVDTGKQYGTRVFTSDVKPPRTVFGKIAQGVAEKIPVTGTGGALGPGGRNAQQAERVAAVDRFVNEYLPNLSSAEKSVLSEQVDNSIAGAASDLSAARQAALAKWSGVKRGIVRSIKGEVPPTQTIKAIDEQVAKLQEVGTDAANAVIAKLQNWRQALIKPAQSVKTRLLDSSGNPIIRTTAEQNKGLPTIELIRKEMGKAFVGVENAAIRDTGEEALSSIYGPMRNDIYAFVEKNGSPQALARFKEANSHLSALAGELKIGAQKRVLQQADTTPEVAANIIFSGKPSDMTRIYAGLSDAGKAKARAAIVAKVAEGSADNGVFSPQKFANGIESMRRSIRVFFSPQERAHVEGFARFLKATQRGAEAAVAPNNGSRAAEYAVVATTMAHPYIAGGIGLLGRIYESAPIRNLLIGLGKTQPGSKAEAQIMQRLMPLIAREMQAIPAAANDIAQAAKASPGSIAAAPAQDQQDAGVIPPQQ